MAIFKKLENLFRLLCLVYIKHKHLRDKLSTEMPLDLFNSNFFIHPSLCLECYIHTRVSLLSLRPFFDFGASTFKPNERFDPEASIGMNGQLHSALSFKQFTSVRFDSY